MSTGFFRIFLVLFIFHWGFAQDSRDKLSQIVTDEAGIFSSEQLTQLRKKLTSFEQETTNQVVVLTVNSLQGETIEKYALDVFNENQLGQEGLDNGLLILFAKKEREVRIEVGYGLEPYITDAIASRIIRETMIPFFKNDEYYEGINLATDQIITFLLNPEALEEFKRKGEQGNQWPIWAYLMLALFCLVFLSGGGLYFFKASQSFISILNDIFTARLAILPGLLILLISALQIVFTIPFILFPVLLLYSVLVTKKFDVDVIFQHNYLFWVIPLVYLLCTSVVALLGLYKKGESIKWSLVRSEKGYFSKTFSSSGSSGGFGSSFGSSSSSFSGGGGSSGGGGASGSW